MAFYLLLVYLQIPDKLSEIERIIFVLETAAPMPTNGLALGLYQDLLGVLKAEQTRRTD